MTSKLPEVSNVSQRGAVALGKTNYTITVREPVAGWKIGNKQFYVDSRGVAFETNYYIEPSLQIVDESGVASKTGMAVASNKLLSFVGRVVAQSNSKGYTVIEAILPSDTTRQLKIKLKDSNIMVKLSIDRSAGEQIEDMDRAIKFIKTKGMYPSYIDVRVSGKAFYK
jgi:cell division septal protein FtsQ